jgi:hypothetical protein
MTSASAADVLRFAAAESPRRNNNKRMTVHLFPVHLFPFPPHCSLIRVIYFSKRCYHMW